MRDNIVYTTFGTCSKQINLQIENDIILNIQFIGGCQGNLMGISQLVIGQNIHDVIKKLRGIKCGPKPTSCPDQLAICLEQYIEQKAKANV